MRDLNYRTYLLSTLRIKTFYINKTFHKSVHILICKFFHFHFQIVYCHVASARIYFEASGTYVNYKGNLMIFYVNNTLHNLMHSILVGKFFHFPYSLCSVVTLAASII